RAKLAYIIDATAAPVCIIAPISSWAAAVNSYVPEDAGITGFQLFLRTIPYNLYALLTLAMVLYICITGLDFGLMKKHEDNAAKGDLFTSGKEEFTQVKQEETNPHGKVIDLVLPVAVLIFSAIGAMIYTGYLDGATDIITAFAGCNAEISLIFATFITILFMLFLYLPRKVVSFKGFMDSFVEGFRLMIPAVGILIFAWTLKGMGDALEIGTFVENIVGNSASASVVLPAIMFIIAVFLGFSTGTSWGTFAILVPIVTAMFPGAGQLEMMVISVSAVLAGAVCGDHVSPISDTTVMSSAGAQSNHINHVSTQMQYAAVVAVVCVIGYIIAGIVQVWWITLIASHALLLIALTVIHKTVGKTG
ncbi:MAG: Na+/H+ antiporter NhaC family protein, partial [Candidatus Choladocola sp.]|nr:Na+/H+ antiporter NhaC family protein [Candidatus Choladocola sp.]